MEDEKARILMEHNFKFTQLEDCSLKGNFINPRLIQTISEKRTYCLPMLTKMDSKILIY